MRYIVLFLAFLCLGACSWLETNLNYKNDPLTGGVNTRTSMLLNTPLPDGFQRYPGHGHISQGPDGKTGLETLRGQTNANAAALAMFNTLKAAGWQLRGRDGYARRSTYIYQKDREYAIITLHPQGMLTIMEICLCPALPDGASLSLGDLHPEESIPSIAGEEYAPDTGSESFEEPGATSHIQEREL